MSFLSAGDYTGLHKKNWAQMLSEFHIAINEREDAIGLSLTDMGAGTYPTTQDIKDYAYANYDGRIEPTVDYFLNLEPVPPFGTLRGIRSWIGARANLFGIDGTWDSLGTKRYEKYTLSTLLGAGSYGSSWITGSRTTRVGIPNQIAEAFKKLYIIEKTTSTPTLTRYGSNESPFSNSAGYDPANVTYESVSDAYAALINSAFDTVVPDTFGDGIGIYANSSWLWFKVGPPPAMTEGHRFLVTKDVEHEFDFSGFPTGASILHATVKILGNTVSFGYDNDAAFPPFNKSVGTLNGSLVEVSHSFSSDGSTLTNGGKVDIGTSFPSVFGSTDVLTMRYTDISGTTLPVPDFTEDGPNAAAPTPEGHDSYLLLFAAGGSLDVTFALLDLGSDVPTWWLDCRPIFTYD